MADQRTTVRNANHGPKVVGQDIMEESATQKHRLGDRLVLGDRVFKYAKSGAVALTAGRHLQSNISLTNFVPHTNYTVGNVTVSVTSTVISTADLYAEGYAVIREGGGEGNTYKIKNNNVGSGGVTKLTFYEPIQEDWVITTTSGVAVTSKYSGVVVGATGLASHDPVGVAIIDVTANYYFWAQTWGPCGVLIGSLSIGSSNGHMLLSNDTATAGALCPLYIQSSGSGVQVSGSGTNTIIATSYLVGSNSATTAKVYPVNLRIEP